MGLVRKTGAQVHTFYVELIHNLISACAFYESLFKSLNSLSTFLLYFYLHDIIHPKQSCFSSTFMTSFTLKIPALLLPLWHHSFKTIFSPWLPVIHSKPTGFIHTFMTSFLFNLPDSLLHLWHHKYKKKTKKKRRKAHKCLLDPNTLTRCLNAVQLEQHCTWIPFTQHVLPSKVT